MLYWVPAFAGMTLRSHGYFTTPRSLPLDTAALHQALPARHLGFNLGAHGIGRNRRRRAAQIGEALPHVRLL